MKLPLLFIYFLLLNGLVFADGMRGSGPQHLLRLATGIDFETNQTTPYLVFAAICLYGVCIVRSANATYKVLQLHNYIAVRVSKDRYAFVFYRRILLAVGELFAAKLAADVAVLLLAHEFSLAGFIIALKLSFLLFIAAGAISCLIFGLFMLSVKPAIVTFISFVTFIAVQLINSASSAGGLIFAPVPKTFTSGSGIIILIKIAELIVAAAAAHAVSRSQYRNLSFMGGSHDKT